jgi:hypothetical protein
MGSWPYSAVSRRAWPWVVGAAVGLGAAGCGVFDGGGARGGAANVEIVCASAQPKGAPDPCLPGGPPGPPVEQAGAPFDLVELDLGAVEKADFDPSDPLMEFTTRRCST